MKLKKILLLSMLLIFSNLLTDCCDNLDYLRFQSLKVKPIEIINNSQNNLHTDSSFKVSNFGLRISFDVSYYSTMHKFSNKLYATQPCSQGYKGSKEKIIELNIKSSADVDSIYRAGVNLNEIIVYKQTVLLSHHNSTDTSYKALDGNYFELMEKGYWQVIKINREEIKDSIHIFTVNLKLSDGREFTKSTFPVNLY